MGLEKPNAMGLEKPSKVMGLEKPLYNERQCMMGLEKLKQQTGMDWAAVI